MRVNTYSRQPNMHYAQLIKDNGGVLAESCGETPEEALRLLTETVQVAVDRWTTALESIHHFGGTPDHPRVLPCGPTCQSHVTHPCEECGVQWGR